MSTEVVQIDTSSRLSNEGGGDVTIDDGALAAPYTVNGVGTCTTGDSSAPSAADYAAPVTSDVLKAGTAVSKQRKQAAPRKHGGTKQPVPPKVAAKRGGSNDEENKSKTVEQKTKAIGKQDTATYGGIITNVIQQQQQAEPDTAVGGGGLASGVRGTAGSSIGGVPSTGEAVARPHQFRIGPITSSLDKFFRWNRRFK